MKFKYPCSRTNEQGNTAFGDKSPSAECIDNNLQCLEKIGALEADRDKYKVSNHIKS